jgi:phosphoesterase RecJ-like protein
MEQRLNIDIANCLYTSILTDTGSFAHANTTREVFWIASNLVQQGVQPEFVHRKVYREKSYAHFRLLSETLERMKTAEEGKIAYSILPLSVYKKTGANDEDNEGLLDTMRALRGGQLFVLIRQEQNDQGKTSMRSTGSINCSYLAGLFGGGGHARASGFSFIGNVEMEGERIMQRIIEQVKTKAWI